MASAAIDASVWLRRNTALRTFGLTGTALTNLALSGKVRTLALPGVAVRYRAGDLEAIRRELADQTAAASA
jgi:hypothetical protein